MDEQLQYYFLCASSHVLCRELPKDFNDWADDKLFAFLEDNAWQPFENFGGEDLYDHILDIAYTINRIVNNQ